jgi:hypothetical protein
MYFTANGEVILLSSEDVTALSLKKEWQTNIPPNLRGSTYWAVDVTAWSAVTLLVTQGSSVFKIICSSAGCSSASGSKPLPLAAGDSIQSITLPSILYPNRLLLISPRRSIYLNSITMSPLDTPIDWSAYVGNFSLSRITSASWLGFPRNLMLVSIGTGSDSHEVGLMVTLKLELGKWRFVTLTFFEQTPGNVVPGPSGEVYWAQSTPDKGLLWKWPQTQVVRTNFTSGERWSDRLVTKVQWDGTLVLASGDPTAHSGFNFWTPYIGLTLNLGTPQFFPSSRGWSLPFLSLPAALNALIATSQNSMGSYDIILVNWPGSFAMDDKEAVEEKLDMLLENHEKIKMEQVESVEVLTASAKLPSTSNANCKPSQCDIDDPGDCTIGNCWGTGEHGKFVCCKKPPV